MTAKKLHTVTTPTEKPAEKPSFAVSPSRTVMPMGPETACFKSIPLKRSAMLCAVIDTILNVSFAPWRRAGKNG